MSLRYNEGHATDLLFILKHPLFILLVVPLVSGDLSLFFHVYFMFLTWVSMKFASFLLSYYSSQIKSKSSTGVSCQQSQLLNVRAWGCDAAQTLVSGTTQGTLVILHGCLGTVWLWELNHGLSIPDIYLNPCKISCQFFIFNRIVMNSPNLILYLSPLIICSKIFKVRASKLFL